MGLRKLTRGIIRRNHGVVGLRRAYSTVGRGRAERNRRLRDFVPGYSREGRAHAEMEQNRKGG
jgi:hypothetical protein